MPEEVVNFHEDVFRFPFNTLYRLIHFVQPRIYEVLLKRFKIFFVPEFAERENFFESKRITRISTGKYSFSETTFVSLSSFFITEYFIYFSLNFYLLSSFEYNYFFNFFSKTTITINYNKFSSSEFRIKLDFVSNDPII